MKQGPGKTRVNIYINPEVKLLFNIFYCSHSAYHRAFDTLKNVRRNMCLRIVFPSLVGLKIDNDIFILFRNLSAASDKVLTLYFGFLAADIIESRYTEKSSIIDYL